MKTRLKVLIDTRETNLDKIEQMHGVWKTHKKFFFESHNGFSFINGFLVFIFLLKTRFLLMIVINSSYCSSTFFVFVAFKPNWPINVVEVCQDNSLLIIDLIGLSYDSISYWTWMLLLWTLLITLCPTVYKMSKISYGAL